MLTYLEAIRNPKKHMVKTLAIGRTAILMVFKSDCPPAWFPSGTIADKNLSMASFLKEANRFTRSPSLLRQSFNKII
jgi:hypothetical protein